jgi:hypothetical protein
MIERRSSFRFNFKSFPRIGLVCNLVRQNLNGNRAFQAGILRFINYPHTPCPKFGANLVMRNGLTDH